MFDVELSEKDRDELIDQVAEWSVKNGLGSIAAFLVEANRPISTISSSFFIGFGGIISSITPIPAHKIGLLLKDDFNVKLLRNKIEELTREQKTKS